MFLKIFPFNKTLFKKDFNMVKLLIIFFIGVVLVTTSIKVIKSYSSFINIEKEFIENNVQYEDGDLIEREKMHLEGLELTSVIVSIVLPITLIAILFGEEKRRKTFEILKVMPYTSYEIFFNKALVALVAIAIPFIVNGLFMLIALGLNSKLRIFHSAK